MPATLSPVPAAVSTLFATATILADAHLRETSHPGVYGPFHLNVNVGTYRLVIDHNGALYSVTLLDSDGVIHTEWDSGLRTAIYLCNAQVQV